MTQNIIGRMDTFTGTNIVPREILVPTEFSVMAFKP